MSSGDTVVGREPCPECGSRDNLARYDDGHGHCFGCEYHEPPRDKGSPRPTSRNRMTTSLIQGEVQALPARRLTEETCKRWGYSVGTARHPKTKKDAVCQIATYRSDDGKAVAQKLRFKDKSMTVVGDSKAINTMLYGKHLWRDGGRMIVVTEGEIDALTVSQLQNNRWPVVSVPAGAQSAHKAIAANVEYLNTFDKIVLMFDDDEAGQAAVEKCAPLLPPGKAYTARIEGYKDANEALQDGAGDRVVDAFWGAKAYRPDGIVSVLDLMDEAAAPTEYGLSWPWPALDAPTYGRRRGELYGIGGGTGIGKTTWFKQLEAHVLTKDKMPAGIIHLEEQPVHTAKTLAGMIDGVRYHVPGTQYNEDQLRETLGAIGHHAHLYDHFGAAGFEGVKDKIRYMRHALGCEDIFLDHLTALAASLDERDERRAIDKMMEQLSKLCLELDITLYYVSHLTAPYTGPPHEEGGRVLESQFRGSRAIGYWTHFLFGIEGNKQEPNSPRVLRCLKDRYTGDAAGFQLGLLYNRETGLLDECELPTEEPKYGFRNEEDDDEPF